jgi:oligopeptide/dipeptide ABC transporter ATP-binding protein
MQLVFQDALDSLNPRLSVAEIVTDPLQLLELARDEKKAAVDQVLDQVSLDPSFKPRLPQELSGGQAQRVGIARGLVIDPDLIVFDEPTSALDATIQAQVLELIHSLIERRDRTYLFVSHDLATIRGLCDRVVVMYLGRVVEDGPVDRIFTTPLHPYTRALLSAIPRLHGELGIDRVELKRDLDESIESAGCSLSPRCPFVETRCFKEQTLLEVSEGHSAACWKVAETTRN